MRLANRLLSTILAGVLAAFSALVAVEIVLGYYLDRNPWLLPWQRWYDRGRELSWSDRSVVVTFVLIGVAGLVLLVAELWRRPPTAFPLAGESSDVHAELTRDVDERADLQVVRRHIETEVLPRFTRAACLERATTHLDLRLEAPTRHVR